MEKYIIHKNGDIVNIKTDKLLKQHIDKYGYKRVNLWIDDKVTQKQVHRLVAIVHLGNPENKPQVNHVNGIKTDNHVENLEWVTNQENRNHAVEKGLHKHQKYEVFKNGIYIGIFKSSQHIANELGLDQGAVCKVANGHYKTTKGYKIIKYGK